MQAFPHRYVVSAGADATGEVALHGAGLPPLRSAPPAEFDGPGDRWSPETLFVAALADCYILTFRALAGVFKLPWTALTCEVEGTVDRVDRVTQFTAFTMRARLTVPAGSDEPHALRLLDRAKHACLVTNSLKAPAHLQASVDSVAPLASAAAR
jgi:organic hydroperoxide reductase OsmC/OhrA